MKKILLVLSLLTTPLFASDKGNVDALKLALDDEYKAKTTYLKVIEDFGNRRPFSKIVQSEQRHIDALLPFFSKYGEIVPSNPYIGTIPSFSSFREACRIGVEAEIANVQVYDRIFSMTTDSELLQVFERLQSASQNKHLLAFQRCAR